MTSRRHPKKAKSFSYDLLAEWVSYANAPPADDWVYHGTVTVNGISGALAWRRGWYGIAVRDRDVLELGMWERIQIGQDIRSRAVAGWDSVPTWNNVEPSIDFRKYLSGYNGNP